MLKQSPKIILALRTRSFYLAALLLSVCLFFLLLPNRVSTQASETCVQPPLGIIAWWPLDETSGTIAEDVIGNNPGAYVNGPVPAAGNVAGALSFDGVDDVVTVPNAPSLNFGPNSPITVELWAYRTGSASVMHFIGKRSGCGFNDFNYQMAFDPTRGLLFGGDPINGPVITGQQMPLNTWTHLAGTFDGTTFRFYINGALAGTSIGTLGPINDALLEIGNSGTCAPFAGLIDEVTIYNRTLSTSEIQAIYDAGSAGKCKSGVIQNGPVTSNVVANPNPAAPNVPVVLTATVSDAATGGSNVAAGEYSVNGGAFMAMNPADGAFDQATEIVTATVPPFSAVGLNTLCVRGTDADGNVGASECIMLPVSSETCVQPPPGAISWWPLDETSGMIAADRVGNHPGAHASGPVPAAGKVRGALRFNGSNHVAVADSDLWAFGANNFTIELWANFDAPGSGSIGEPGDIFIGNDEGPGLVNKWFFALGGGVLDFTVFNVNSPPSNLFLVRAPFSPIVGQWYHLAVTKRGTLFTIFVNGIPVGSEISTSPIANANAPLTIGQAENIGFMNGRLDEISIYNRALTQEELQAIYDAGSAGKCINLDIRPNKGGDTGRVSVHISGTGFAQGATVRLVRVGNPDIVAVLVAVGDDGTTIDTGFDLTGKTRGAWDLVVTNPSATAFTLSNGFTIEEGRAARVWVDIVGLNLIRPGRAQSFHVFYGNTGNVDAVGVPLWIAGIPSDATLDLRFDVLPPVPIDDPTVAFGMVPTSINVGNELVVPLLVSVIPTGSTGVLEFKLTITNAQPVRLRAWTNPPLFRSPPSEDVVDCIIAIVSEATGQILDNDCTVAVLTDLFDLVSDLGPNTVVNLSWAVLDAGFRCAVTSACKLCTRRLTQACVFCVSGKIIEFGLDIYDAWQTGTACANTGIQIGETFLDVSPVNSFDPNDKVGSQGAGEDHFLSGEEPFRYSVLFENLGTANAPAQEVLITDQLDTMSMDFSTFSLGPIAFGNKQVIPPPGASAFATDVDLRPDKNLIVRITATLNPNTGLLTWRFTSIDPATGNPPEDPLSGFLPPNINPPEGDGSVLFTVMPKKGLATGTEIRNKARIIFDVNEPIDTPEWFNTIDNSQSASNVLPLTASQCASDFQVQWAGTDEGSGIANYTIYVSDNGAPFTIWQNTTATSGIYAGQFNHTYAFYSLAQDKTGNIENPPPNPDATVNLSAPAPPIFTSVPPAITVYTGQGATACGTFVSDATLGMTTAQSPCSTVNVTRSGVPTGNIFPVGNTTITYMATDASGNTATATQTVTVIDNTPPVITAESVSPASLWPPNHTMRDITVNYTAVDNCSSTCTLSVTSNEPINGAGDGDTEPDWEIVDASHVRLRAERAAIGNGRTYSIMITCTDGAGNSTSREVTVCVAHNITGPTSGAAFKIGTAVNFAGTFWDVPGKTHTVRWTFDDVLSTTAKVVEPSGLNFGTVTGTYTFTTPGVYKIKMKVTDNTGQTSWVDTAGDVEAIVVIYDPNGGYTIGGGHISAFAGSYPADPSKTGKLSFGFNSKYTNATNPKGETQIKFAVGGLEFNALNYDYLAISSARAQFRGFGKVNGESGYNFILTVIDGQLTGGGGVDKFRIKIWNKTTGALVFDSQTGASDAADPSTPVGTGSSIVIQK